MPEQQRTMATAICSRQVDTLCVGFRCLLLEIRFLLVFLRFQDWVRPRPQGMGARVP